MLTCVAAGLALAFTPVFVWRITTGKWVCFQQPETFYYLQVAAQAFYNHLWYISDPVVADGVTFYPWLQFVPAALIARTLGLSIFSIAIIWAFVAGVGIGASLYLVFCRFLRRPWLPAGLTIFCMSDLGFCGHLVVVPQLKRLVSAIVIHPSGKLLDIPSFFFQWRAPDPALDLPFLFLQILALSNARERPRRLNLWLSGLVFGILFYVFFYLWTIVAAALVIAFILDPAGRKAYRWTILVGAAIGLPQLAINLYSRARAYDEGVGRLALFVPVSKTPVHHLAFPFLSVAIVIFVGLWISKTGRYELIYLVSLLIAGILLGSSGLIAGISLHEYHYLWLWYPIRLVLVLIVVATVAESWIPRRAIYSIALSTFVIIYLLSGIYLLAIDVTRTEFGIRQRDDFVRYRAQRMVPDAPALVPRSVIAGSERFCELAGVAENQRMISGWTVPISVALDDSGWESRFALTAFLMGTDRDEFARQTTAKVQEYNWGWNGKENQLIEAFMHKFDEVTQNPDKYVRSIGVRYIALPADQPAPAYVASHFRILQPGPNWQIWQLQQ